MDKRELIKKLNEIHERQATDRDFESHHVWADDLLLDYIADDEIKNAYDSIRKWYA